MPDSKRCSRCRESKPLTEFNKKRCTKDGLQPQCKACCREYQLKYRQANREAERERLREYHRQNPEKTAAKCLRRRARKAGVPSDGVPVDITDQPCYVCGAPAEAVDHVIPIAKGGPDTIDNKMPICNSCNSAKGAHIWPDKPGWDEFVERRRNQND